MPKENRVISETIPHTKANEELVLSLLDRFIDVTGVSFGELSNSFYYYMPDELGELRYHGRQVSFYLKRERPISPNHWHGIANFVYSDEFIDKVPEAKVVIRRQESSIEAGVYFAKLNGLINDAIRGRSFPMEYTGFWDGSGGSNVFFQHIEGYPFAVIHGKSIQSPAIWSGFIFPTLKSIEYLTEHYPYLKTSDTSDIFEVYVWDRLSRQKMLSEIFPLTFLKQDLLMLTGLSFHPSDLERDLDEVVEQAIHDLDENGNAYVANVSKSTVKKFQQHSCDHYSFAGHNKQEVSEHSEKTKTDPDSHKNDMQYFVDFIDTNLWGVLSNGTDS